MHIFLFLTLALAVLSATGASPITKRATSFPAPTEDDFYAVPQNIADFDLGAVFISRTVPSTIVDVNLDTTYQIAYRTSNAQLQADATVATVWTPKMPASPPRLLVYQVAEDAVQLDCAPSWAFVKGSASKSFLSASSEAPTYIKWALSQGIYVVLSDSLGFHGGFGVQTIAAYTILDGVRATISFFNLPPDTPLVLGGHWTVAYAANLAGVYAPELNIIGAVHGGTSVDGASNYKYLLGGPASAYGGLIVAGMMHAYPQFNMYMDAILTKAGHDDLYKLYERGMCVLQAIPAGAYVNYSTETTIGPEWLDEPFPKTLFARTSLLTSVNPTGVYAPKFPSVQFHAAQDELVSRQLHEKFVQEQCKAGASVVYAVLPVKNHISATLFAVPGAINALSKIFNGNLDTRYCGSTAYSQGLFIRPDSNEAIAVLGKEQAQRIDAFNGQQSFIGPIAW